MFRSRHRILLPGTPSEEFSVGSATRRRRSGAMAQATQCLAEPPLRRGFCRRWQRGLLCRWQRLGAQREEAHHIVSDRKPQQMDAGLDLAAQR
jgi:hypothetical protein